MIRMPEAVSRFLAGKRFAVAGVSRHKDQAANAIYRKLKEAGYTVYAVNPKASAVEGDRCYPDLAAVPGPLDGVMIVTHPRAAPGVVGQCAQKGVPRVWLHRSFGNGSVSTAALQAAEEAGIEAIEGGCPLMFLPPVDLGHKCMRWWLQRSGRVPRAA